MEKTELEMQVSKVVADLFNQKEDAEIRRRTEIELQKAAASISELTNALEAKNVEVSEYEEKATETAGLIKKLESELEAAKKELDTANTKLGETEKAFNEMKKDRATEIRMKEIEDAGVARSDRDAQIGKVREMSDEEFASYKEELISIREAVLAELEKAREKAEVDAKATEEAAKKAEEEAAKKAELDKMKKDGEEDEEDKMKKNKKAEKASGEVEEPVVPARITPGQAAMASLNMEFVPSKDLMTKYSEMGKAMAERWKKSNE
jgi:colicin import membrane protein